MLEPEPGFPKSETDLREFRLGTLFWPESLFFGIEVKDMRRAFAVLIEFALLTATKLSGSLWELLRLFCESFVMLAALTYLFALGGWTLGMLRPTGLWLLAFRAFPMTEAATSAFVLGAGAELKAPTPV